MTDMKALTAMNQDEIDGDGEEGSLNLYHSSSAMMSRMQNDLFDRESEKRFASERRMLDKILSFRTCQ